MKAAESFVCGGEALQSQIYLLYTSFDSSREGITDLEVVGKCVCSWFLEFSLH